MKSKSPLFIIFMLTASLFMTGCQPKTVEVTQPEDETASDVIPFGGEKDEHGCVLKDGYSWCDANKKCIKLSEENCEKGESVESPKSNYYLVEDALMKKNNLKTGEFRLGIKSLQNAHFRGIVNGEDGVTKDGIILAVKENNDWIIVIDTVFGENKTYTCAEVAEHYFPEEMILDCLTE